MKIFSFFLFFYSTIHLFGESFLLKNKLPNIILKNENVPFSQLSAISSNAKIINYSNIKKKLTSYNQLLRLQNIFPCIILNFVGTMIVSTPLWVSLTKPKFYLLTFISLLIMTSSMVINDIFDMKVDKINNIQEDKPLLNGSINLCEASFIYAIIQFLLLYINDKYVKSSFVYIAMISTFLYTPLLKRILFIKNYYCAALISSTLLFSVNNLNIIPSPKDKILLDITYQIMLCNTFILEMIYDINDIIGDRLCNIYTIPVVFGRDITLLISSISLFITIVHTMAKINMNNLFLVYFLHVYLIFSLFNLLSMKIYNYSYRSLTVSSKNIKYLLYFYIIALFISKLFF